MICSILSLHWRRLSTNRKAFTLIEVVLSTAVIAILSGVVVLLMNSIIESWQYSQNRLDLQKAASDIMNELLQGGFEAIGIRDASDFISCGPDSIAFLPLWVDDSHKPDPVANKEQKFTLNRQFKAGSSIPLAQYKKMDSDDWITASVGFTYGELTDPKKTDDVAQITDPIPYGAKIKFTFTPEAGAHTDVRKSFTWNKSDKHIYATYKDETKDIIRTMPNVKVERLLFIYFNNLNQELMSPEKGYLTVEQMKTVSAIKIYLLLTKKGDWRESVSYTNVRNVSGVGISIAEGAALPIPGSARIKALSIGNLFGRKKDGIVRLVVKPDNCPHWAIELKIVPDSSSPERLKIDRFQMESPPGRVLTSARLDRTFMISEFVNLQSMDRTGIYDYDDDEGIDDFYANDDDPASLEVERLDFDGASLFVKP